MPTNGATRTLKIVTEKVINNRTIDDTQGRVQQRVQDLDGVVRRAVPVLAQVDKKRKK
jgi:D-Tyr-tRNAtyr deacylase